MTLPEIIDRVAAYMNEKRQKSLVGAAR